ncbi:transporter [Parashewanella curva]|uniref:Transporter n=1 Tax=Parashewanella curva TaxID=2338552 RepID=A0A3L8PWY5_9GAMM|nr:OmpP1/FadL family transporter [Parashewanella curva]RLV59811.1 transporter [Parashewanella curva]
MTNLKKLSFAIATTLLSTQTFAAGFQVNAQSANGIGRAWSGDAAIADNAAVLARNPAAMSMFKKRAFSGGITYAATDVEVRDVAWKTAPVSFGHNDSAAESKAIPNLFYIHPYSDKIAFGVGLFSNFGTGTDNKVILEQNPDRVMPTDLLGNTEVTTINLNGSISYKINEHVSLGFGLDIIRGGGKLSRKTTDPRQFPVCIKNTPNGDCQNVDLVNVDATGWGIGGIVGALFQLNENNRWGISYRVSPEFKAKGDLDLFAGGLTPASFDELILPLPNIFQVAGFHQVNDKFAVHYTAKLTQWSRFDQITLKGGKLGKNPVPDRPLKVYEWKDSWLYSVGGTYTINDTWKVRAGYMFDNSVIDKITSISLPDSDRNWYTAGVSYKLNESSTIDFGYANVRGKYTKVDEYSKPANANAIAFTKGSANYFSVQYSREF